MSEFQNNFNLVQTLLSRRAPPDVAHGIAHMWLDKRSFLTMEDPIGALAAQLKSPRRDALRSMPGHKRVVARVDALHRAQLTDPLSFVNSLTPDELQVIAQALDIVLGEGENLCSHLLYILSAEGLGMLPALSGLEALAKRRPEAALGSVIGKLTKVLQQRQRQLEEFADGLIVQEYEVVHMALDLWA
jgi:hypothetical protein